jgi:SAM-dependent methyltransferase
VLLPASTFDCITAFDVLEHLAHPGMCMRQLAIALRPGGVLIAETGDAGSRVARLLGPAWYYLNYLEHFQAFSQESLEAVLTRSKLRAVRMDRVSRFPAQPGPMLRVATRAIAYSVAVWARSPSLWRYICETVQRGSDGAPPDTGWIEDDHLLVVAVRR